MIIAAYRGKSLLSKAIKWQTRGAYSHIAVMLADDQIIEAWHSPSKVRVIRSLSEGHSKNTTVDLFDVETTPEQTADIHRFLNTQVGKSYDFVSVLRFMSRRQKDNPDKWFCSELAFAAFRYAGIDLLKRIEPFEVDPSAMSTSPLLRFVDQVIT